MSERVKMPALGESVTEGTVTRWLKQIGERVEIDEPLLEVSTDKVDTEIPSPIAGTLEQVLVGEDETVPVGADLAVVGDGSVNAAGALAAPSAGTSAEPSADLPPAVGVSSPHSDHSGTAGDSADRSSGAENTVRMPALGESVTEGTLTRWLKAEGDTVEVDEPLLEVSTDKVDTEVPSPVSGVVRRLLVQVDETVPVGADLVTIGAADAHNASPDTEEAAADSATAERFPGASPTSPSAASQQLASPAAHERFAPPPAPSAFSLPVSSPSVPVVADPPAPSTPPAAATPSLVPGGLTPPQPASPAVSRPLTSGDVSVYVTPLVRKLAAEHQVDLTTVTGTGVGGRVRKQDVLDAAQAQRIQATSTAGNVGQASSAAVFTGSTPTAARPAVPTPASAKRGTTEKMSRLRRVIAARMVESLQTSAQLTTVVEVDVTKIARLRDRAKADFRAREGVSLSFLPFFAQAAVEALKVHPTVNASLADDQIVYHAEENLGVAVDTDKGLIVPVIRDAGAFNIAGIARKIADLAERTRASKISPDELGGGTFTLTNTGSRGALFDTPIINQPQVAILGTGAVVKRPVVVRDQDGGETIAIRSMVYLALSYDHRIVDGADAARFLGTMKERLEEGSFDADLGL